MIRTARARPFVGRRIFYVPSTPSPFQIVPPKTAPLRLPQPSNFSRIGRRYNHNAAKDVVQPTAQAAPEAPKSIPGPSWLWLEPVYEPFRAYGRIQQRRPYWTQFISSLVIYFVGDVVAQSVSTPDKATETPTLDSTTSETLVEDEDRTRGWVQTWMEDRDWARTARALFIGGAAAVPGYRWFLWLSNSFNYRSKVLSLTTKVWQCVYCWWKLCSLTMHATGRCKPADIHTPLQHVLLWHPIVPIRRNTLGGLGAYQKHCPNILVQLLQAVAGYHSFHVCIRSIAVSQYIRWRHCDWLANVLELIESTRSKGGERATCP
jgi:hypothetical protein